MSGTRSLRRDAVRNAELISVAAMEVFAERGFAASLDDVAHRAGVGVGTVYRRFGDKRSLIAGIFEAEAARVTAAAESARTRDDPAVALVELLEHISELLAANKGLRQLILTDDFAVLLAGEPVMERLVHIVDAMVADATGVGLLRASFAPGDVHAILVAVQAVREATGSGESALWRRTLRMLIDGIRSDSRVAIEMVVPDWSRYGQMAATAVSVGDDDVCDRVVCPAPVEGGAGRTRGGLSAR